MTKIVLNTKIGGFSLSYQGMLLYGKLSGFSLEGYIEKDNTYINCREITDIEHDIIYYVRKEIGNNFPLKTNQDWVFENHYNPEGWIAEKFSQKTKEDFRSDENLIKTVLILGDLANGTHADLKILEIPDGVKWYVRENETGVESIHELHRIWSHDD